MEEKSIQGLMNNLNTLLRHVAAGFIGIAFVWLFDGGPDNARINDCLSKQPLIAVVVAVAYGLLLSAIHRNVLYPILYRTVVYPLARKTRKPGPAIELDFQRFKRRYESLSEKAAIQKELDGWAPLIHFLYCSGWAVLGACLYLLKWRQQPLSFWYWAGYFSIAFGIVIMAIFGNWRYARRELELQRLEKSGSDTSSVEN
jgi:uncharacterized membrane protein